MRQKDIVKYIEILDSMSSKMSPHEDRLTYARKSKDYLKEAREREKRALEEHRRRKELQQNGSGYSKRGGSEKDSPAVRVLPEQEDVKTH